MMDQLAKHIDDSPLPGFSVEFTTSPDLPELDPDIEARKVIAANIDDPARLYDVIDGLVFGRFNSEPATDDLRHTARAWIDDLLRPYGLRVQQLFDSERGVVIRPVLVPLEVT